MAILFETKKEIDSSIRKKKGALGNRPRDEEMNSLFLQLSEVNTAMDQLRIDNSKIRKTLKIGPNEKPWEQPDITKTD